MSARAFVGVLGLAVFAACSPTKPGPQAGVTYFWHVTSSTVSFSSMCSDDPMFRKNNGALEFADNSYIVYVGSADGKKATVETCTALDPSTCTPAMSGVVFDVAGGELSYESDTKTAIPSSTCNQLDSQTWLLEDMVMTMDLQISDTLSLVDDDVACGRIETDAETHSPNMQGYQGCTITFDITGDSN